MIPILKKEVSSFFASPIGYLVIGLFLVVNGLFLWVFAGDYNILDAGFADLSAFFELAPWIFIFLIPAVTMRSFSEELKLGTLELLVTKPISLRGIVLGKYFGAVVLIVMALLPTLLYVYTISVLGSPAGNWDVGSTFGSYLGLLFLVMAFSAIGLFASTLSPNQIVAFILGVFLCFVFYFGFEGLASMANSSTVSELGLQAHYTSISRGVVDTRDVVYFLSIAFVFVASTVVKLKRG